MGLIYFIFLFYLFTFSNAYSSKDESDSEDGGSEITAGTCRYADLTLFLITLQANFSRIGRLYSIGKSNEGRDLWVYLISGHPYERQLLRPQIKFVGNIIGNNGPTCYVLLRLIMNLLQNYKDGNSLERELVEATEIHILPNMNPDGFHRSIPGECRGGTGRYNAAGKDLNRDFPDFFNPIEGKLIQPETMAIIEWINENSFSLSVSLISGTKVVSYPYDSSKIAEYDMDIIRNTPRTNPTFDDDMFQHLSKTYVKNVNETIEDKYGVEAGSYCPVLSRTFKNGIINGAEWSHASGTMMDYNYNKGIFEILVGIACCRNENDTILLDGIWKTNKQALLTMIKEVTYGIRGQVIDSETHAEIAGARMIKRNLNYNRDRYNKGSNPTPVPWHTTSSGEYWRLIIPGKYSLTINATGYKEKTIEFEGNLSRFTVIMIEMDKYVPTTTTTTERNTRIDDDDEVDRSDKLNSGNGIDFKHEFFNESNHRNIEKVSNSSKYNSVIKLSSKNFLLLCLTTLPTFLWI